MGHQTLGQVLLSTEQTRKHKTMAFLRGERHRVKRGEGEKKEDRGRERSQQPATAGSQAETVISNFQWCEELVNQIHTHQRKPGERTTSKAQV